MFFKRRNNVDLCVPLQLILNDFKSKYLRFIHNVSNEISTKFKFSGHISPVYINLSVQKAKLLGERFLFRQILFLSNFQR